MEGAFELPGSFTVDEKGALVFAFGRSYLNELEALSVGVMALELHDSHFLVVLLEESSTLLVMSADGHPCQAACQQAVSLGVEAAKKSFQPA